MRLGVQVLLLGTLASFLMNRTVQLVVGLMIGLGPLGLAQDAQVRPQVPEEAFSTRELIAWSSLQKPRPTPQPLPSPDKPIPQPDQQPAHSDNESATQSQDESVRTFSGTILKVGAGYALKVDAATTYRLENAGDLAQFEEKTVKVEGVLNSDRNTIHVTRITQSS